ncbi:MAG: thiamine diphosphokinase [Candidatus Delongbacteria bacterium]|nr:thiamine diphosphokinase [Candidatus Delongbacteria bacterium]
MKTKTAILVLNGKDFYARGFRDALEDDPEFVIAVDGGIAHLEGLTVPPVIHIGDMDSSAPDSKVPVMDTLIFPPDKDRSDFFLALDLVYKKNVKEVTVFAAFGGRTDHFLSNYDTAIDFASRGMKITFSGEKEDIFFLPCNAPEIYEFSFPEGSTVSVFSGTEKCDGVTLEGFKYPLNKALLSKNIPLGLSNMAVSGDQRIDFENGTIVVIFNKKS